MNQAWLPFNGAVLPFVVALGASYLLTWCARSIAPSLGLVDQPDGERKLHARPTPLMGGVAIFAAIVVVCSGAVAGGLSSPSRSVLGVLLGGACFLLLGLWDDGRPLRARTKLAWQVLATVPFLFFCGWIEQVTAFGFVWDPGPLAIPFTMFWLVACVNIVNLLDGHDGLASAIGLIGLGSLAALTWMHGGSELTVFCLIAAGAIAGFLIHNWPPARIFLGDAGSMMIGFLVGALSMETSLKTAATFTLITPIAVLCVPIFDTAMAILRRNLSGRSIGAADRGHIHHRLEDSGFSRLQTLLVISGLCFLTAIAAIAASWLQRDAVGAVMCISLLLLVVASGLFGDREMALVLRHVWAVSSLVPGAGHAFSARLLVAKLNDPDADERRRFSEALRQRFINAGGEQIRLVAMRQDGQPIRTTRAPLIDCEGDAAWRFTYHTLREDGYRMAITVSGQSYRGLGGQRLEDVFRLLDAACRTWPFEDLDELVEVLNGDSHQSAEAARSTIDLPQKADSSRAA